MSRDVAVAIGTVLKRARIAASLSQEKLAELAYLDRTTPSLYERGLRQPTIGAVIAVSRAVGLDPAVLVEMTIAGLRAKSGD